MRASLVKALSNLVFRVAGPTAHKMQLAVLLSRYVQKPSADSPRGSSTSSGSLEKPHIASASQLPKVDVAAAAGAVEAGAVSTGLANHCKSKSAWVSECAPAHCQAVPSASKCKEHRLRAFSTFPQMTPTRRSPKKRLKQLMQAYGRNQQYGADARSVKESGRLELLRGGSVVSEQL